MDRQPSYVVLILVSRRREANVLAHAFMGLGWEAVILDNADSGLPLRASRFEMLITDNLEALALAVVAGIAAQNVFVSDDDVTPVEADFVLYRPIDLDDPLGLGY